jgi:hypothetical protein
VAAGVRDVVRLTAMVTRAPLPAHGVGPAVHASV